MQREVVTFQFGNYSNFIGTHFWNIQESYFVYDQNNKTELNLIDLDHDVLFREGLNYQNRVTYTPRMILVDFKDKLNAMKQTGDLVENDIDLEPTCLPTWSGKIDVHHKPQIEKSEYMKDLELETSQMQTDVIKTYPNIDNQVSYWSDYLRIRLHSRSILLLNSNHYSTSDVEPFDLYHNGLEATKEGDFLEDYENRLRLYAEECDNIQGFHFFVDAYNGFGGLCKDFLSLINEEYAKKPVLSIFSFPNNKNNSYESQMIKIINTALTMQTFFTEVDHSIVLPLSLFNALSVSKEQTHLNLDPIQYNSHLYYHTSAILASLVDSFTTPWRQNSQYSTLIDVYNSLDVYSEKIATLQALAPLELENNQYLFNYLQENNLFEKGKYFTPVWNHIPALYKTQNADVQAQILCCKGIPDDRVKNPNDTCLFSGVVPANKVIDAYCKEVYEMTKSSSYSSAKPLNMRLPFPNILKTSDYEANLKKGIYPTMSTLTMLQMNKTIKYTLQSMTHNMDKCDIKHFNRYFDAGMEADDFNELKNFTNELYTLYSS